MGKRRLYTEPVAGKVTSATVDYLRGREVSPGYVRFVTHAGIEDQTTAPTTLSFGREIGKLFEVLEEDPAPLVGITYHTAKTHHFLAGEKPAFRIEGGTLNDVLRAYLEGYEEETA